MTTTALQRIKEIETYFPILAGQAAPNCYKSGLGAISMNVAYDIEFLLKAFNAMREIAIHERTKRLNYVAVGSLKPTFQVIDDEFQERMSKEKS